MRTPVSTLLTTVSVAAGVMLSGCSGDPEPREPEPSSSSTPDPTATPPPLPEAATVESTEGAAAFVDYYLEVLNYAAHTGDTDPVRDLSGPECGSCDNYISTVSGIYEDGGRVVGGDWSAGDLLISEGAGYWTATGEVVTAAGTQQDDGNSQPREAAETRENLQFVLAFEAERWTMFTFAGAPQ